MGDQDRGWLMGENVTISRKEPVNEERGMVWQDGIFQEGSIGLKGDGRILRGWYLSGMHHWD